MRNTLYYGDNLAVLRDHIPTASVDLVYLDPPCDSNRSYNVLFKEESGMASQAQIQAFDDTWHWPGAVETYHELTTQTGGKVGEMIGAPRRTAPRPQANGLPLPPLRPDGEPLFQGGAGYDLRAFEFQERSNLEADNCTQ